MQVWCIKTCKPLINACRTHLQYTILKMQLHFLHCIVASKIIKHWFPRKRQKFPQEASWQNHAFMSAVPNFGLRYIRIHSLFNLLSVHTPNVTHPIPASTYDWTLLEEVMDMLVLQHGKNLVVVILLGNSYTEALHACLCAHVLITTCAMNQPTNQSTNQSIS